MGNDKKKVFVVHGRNISARDTLFAFLRSIGLDPIEWNEALSHSACGSPYIGDILEHAFQVAQAVIVLITGDDFAYLNPCYWKKDDNDYEKQPTPQARPNVLFEAGLAFGTHPNRTVLVQLGSVRPFSDIAGRHVVNLTNDPRKRHELVTKLKNSGCDIEIEGKSDWMKEGDFEVAGQVPSKSQTVNVLDNDSYPYHWLVYNVSRVTGIDYSNLRLLISAKMSMRVRSNCQDLAKIGHSIGAGNNRAINLMDASIRPINSDFKRSSKGIINFEVKRITESTVNWELIFNPRLEINEVADYAVEWKYYKGFLSHEEFATAKAVGLIPLDREFESLERTTSVPCERLISTIVFPCGYEIIDPNFVVKKGNVALTREIGRIRDNKFFTVHPPTATYGWRLELDVLCPFLDVSYLIQWKPPRLDSLLSNNLISLDQKNTILKRIRQLGNSTSEH